MNILIFGDSVTQGYHDHEYAGWVNRLAAHSIQKEVASDSEYHCLIFNLGISGGNTDTLLERAEVETKVRASARSDVIIFAIGVNDTQFDFKSQENRVPKERFASNIEALIETAKKYVDRVILVSVPLVDEKKLNPIPWKPSHAYQNQYIEEYNQIRKQLTEKYGCLLIELEGLFAPDEYDTVYYDGLHPNAEGHRRIFERVKGVLEKEEIL